MWEREREVGEGGRRGQERLGGGKGEKDELIVNLPILSFFFYFAVLKRFTGYRFRTKLETNIGIPQMLDLSHFVSPDFTGELYCTWCLM